MKKLNNKGFTLVELLAVLVILIAIMAIAIPSISSSLERSKAKQNESRQKILESSAELFVTDYKNKIYNNMSGSDCYITVDQLLEEGYITADQAKDSDDNQMTGNIIYNKTNNSYTYGGTSSNPCMS